MVDVYLTQTEFEDLFQSLLTQMIGGSPTPDVRISWPIGGAPGFEIDDDICFIRCTEIEDNYNICREFKYEDAVSPEGLTKQVAYTRVMQVFMIFYGPNSYDRAADVKDKIQYQEYHDILAAERIFHIPDNGVPRRVPENWAGKWWQRVDLIMKFNEEIKRSSSSGYVKSVDVELHQENGNETIITIQD